ncbi:MAG: glycosyltransferase [Candidatus Gottesmanbacteria bacterium GW2011_GWA2_43_14]|uniref:Glycosyltransferase n=1 Tax=Candidatus Gottesmanbacteria bacterium GW2011_GWA2_43_14 TaxID=1618443 RepID=A0A0G1GIX5_9BACT|nr:MAG: glycosyltransferase [Candidatus Gottesmanbacteria bacterium GW2011_GWA2_43_14]
MTKTQSLLVAAAFFIYLLANVFLLKDYGVTWDFSYHYNAGLFHLDRTTETGFKIGPSPPLSDILPVLSKILFSDRLRWLPWNSAYNLYSVVLGSTGILVLFFFASSLFNWQTGLFSAIILALLPRYFGHLHNNMKDIPQAVFFTLSLYCFWALVNKPSFKKLIFSVLAFALAFNSKVNAVFIPFIAIAWLLIRIFTGKIRLKKLNSYVHLYFFLAPLFAFFLWSIFWPDPLARLAEATHSYTTSTTNMPLLYFGSTVYSGNNVPWHYPLGIFLATTPILIILTALIGLMLVVRIIFKSKAALFTVLWFFLPLSRYLKPGMAVIDDVRHFMEVLYPLSLLAGIGTLTIFNRLPLFYKRAAYTVFFIYLLIPVVTFHPHQTSYFSEAVGGINRAQNKFDIEFWANAYKQALPWLNQHAPLNSKITVAMAPDIARLYLRQDLKDRLGTVNLGIRDDSVYTTSDYTVILNRQSFYNWYAVNSYMSSRQPVFSLTVHNVPLVRIYQNKK